MYAHICIQVCFGLHFTSHTTSLLPLAMKIAHNSKVATQNYQIESQNWPDITAFSVNIIS